ncbi:hypothetical protein ACF0H5_017311 [Mactra antiquata]
MAELLLKFGLLCILSTVSVKADYDCACNFNVEKAVYPTSDTSGTPVGYLYEFDCKPIATQASASSGFIGIQFEGKLAYLEVDNQIQQQTCGGNPSPTDLIPPPTTPPKSVNGQWSDWQEWAQCVTSCGPGTRSRTRACDSPAPSNGGQTCTGDSTDTIQCDNGPCPIDGAWSPWQTWSKCSVSCEAGTRTRNRNCDNPVPEFDGSPCEGDNVENGNCNDGPCPVDGAWTKWTIWTQCSVTCGGGTHTRTRTCSYPDGVPHGNDCVGSSSDSESFDGAWTAWTTWSKCPVTCGGGTHTRTRSCSYPDGVPHGNDCVGSSSDSESCNSNLCPVDGVFTDWSTWSKCSVTCGGGTHTRTRTCSYPDGVPHGNECAGSLSASESCNTDPCPVDGVFTVWSTWSKCSVTCGGGTHTRTRTCSYPDGVPHGNDCAGSLSASESCNTDPCPVDGVFTDWLTWSKCSVTCGGGTHTRTRSCSYPNGVPHGNDCVGSLSASESCNTNLCPVDGVWKAWTSWSSCSVTCGGGTHTRARTCSYPTDVPHGNACVGSSKDTQACNSNKCPVDGVWTAWTTWTQCSVTCGGGTHTRTRSCSYPDGVPHGNTCNGLSKATQTCNTNKCPVDGVWSHWTAWSTCPVTCGGGTHTRTRTCNYQADAPHGKACVGSTSASETCGTKPCPVDGQWSDWQAWSRCSATCGEGRHTRNRTCSEPAPAHGGSDCLGSSTTSGTCTPGICPVDGVWLQWTSWSSCTLTCGGGTHTRTRSCHYPPHVPHGEKCVGPSTNTGSCNTRHCPVDGHWASWQAWTSCSVTCAKGVRSRSRTCTHPSPAYGGSNCTGASTNQGTCDAGPCPVDGHWSNWLSWSSCSVTCAAGTKTRNRTCTNPAPAHGGSKCIGATTNSGSCNPRPCPVDGHWSHWTTWSSCSVTCAKGTQTRTRDCTNPAPLHGGHNCTGVLSQNKDCNPGPCPIDGHWSSWLSWTQCSVSCADGTRTRNRTCTNPAPAYHGKNCAGSGRQTGHCNNGPCPIDGHWGPWSSYGACSVTCETGRRTRTRKCNHPAPQYGGHKCPGSATSYTSCQLDACIVNVTGTPYQYVGVGYNLLTGNPETTDPGLLSSRRIFEMTGKPSSVREVTYDKHASCSVSKSTVLLHGSKAYQDELKNLIQPDGSHNRHMLDAAFTYNSHFEAMRNNLDNKDAVYLDKVTSCVLGTLTFNTGGSSKYDGSFSISKEFAKDLCALPVDLTASSSSSYMTFFNKWGTSIVTSIDVGTKTTERYTTTPAEVYNHVQKTDPKLFEASGTFQGYNASVAINTHDYSNSAAVAGSFGDKHTTNIGTSQNLVPVGGEVISITEALNPKFWQTVIDKYVNTGVCPSSIKNGGLQTYADNLHMALGQYPSYKDQQTGYNYTHTQLLDRHNIQVPVSWPKGTYGLMQTVTGCPSGSIAWKGGYLVQDTEDSTHSNSFSPNLASYMKGRFLSTSIRTEFCIKTTVQSTNISTYDHDWPAGTYCVLKYKACPTGFSEGYIKWDDENTNNGNTHHGYLPDGVYGVDTTIKYCCRHDSSASTAMYLPTDRTFILVRYGTRCQTVSGMSFKDLYIKWDDQSTTNKDAAGGVHPYEDGGTGDQRLHFCYYETLVPAAPPLIG